jgi:hypothetical protein
MKKMSKRVQLPPPELDAISRGGASDDNWVVFPNGKKRRKASSVDRIPKRPKSVSLQDQCIPYIVNRVRGNRWQIEASQKDSLKGGDCENKKSRMCIKEPCEVMVR